MQTGVDSIRSNGVRLYLAFTSRKRARSRVDRAHDWSPAGDMEFKTCSPVCIVTGLARIHKKNTRISQRWNRSVLRVCVTKDRHPHFVNGPHMADAFDLVIIGAGPEGTSSDTSRAIGA